MASLRSAVPRAVRSTSQTAQQSRLLSSTSSSSSSHSITPPPTLVRTYTTLTSRSTTISRFYHSSALHLSSPHISARSFSSFSRSYDSSSSSSSNSGPTSSSSSVPRSRPPPPADYNFNDISNLVASSPSAATSSPHRILIDVREPSELSATGRIPGAKSMPIASSPDSFFMDAEDFEDKFGFPRPGADDEVIFYCKAGVRSRQAALLAQQAQPAFGGKVGNYQGSWLDWERNGGEVEKEEDESG